MTFIPFRKGFALYDRIRETCMRQGYEPTHYVRKRTMGLDREMVSANPLHLENGFSDSRLCNNAEVPNVMYM
jgi:hypothetical protein